MRYGTGKVTPSGSQPVTSTGMAVRRSTSSTPIMPSQVRAWGIGPFPASYLLLPSSHWGQGLRDPGLPQATMTGSPRDSPLLAPGPHSVPAGGPCLLLYTKLPLISQPLGLETGGLEQRPRPDLPTLCPLPPPRPSLSSPQSSSPLPTPSPLLLLGLTTQHFSPKWPP